MNSKTIINSFKAVAVAYVISFLLLIIFNFLSYTTKDPDKLLSTFGYITLAFAALAAGFIAIKLNGDQIVSSGIMSGAIFIVVFTILFFIFGGGNNFNLIKIIIYYLGILIIAILGSFIGAPRIKSTAQTRKFIKKKYKI